MAPIRYTCSLLKQLCMENPNALIGDIFDLSDTIYSVMNWQFPETDEFADIPEISHESPLSDLQKRSDAIMMMLRRAFPEEKGKK